MVRSEDSCQSIISEPTRSAASCATPSSGRQGVSRSLASRRDPQIYGTHLPDMRGGKYPFGVDQRKASPYNSPLQKFAEGSYSRLSLAHIHQNHLIRFMANYGGGDGVSAFTSIGTKIPVYLDSRLPTMTWNFIVRAW